MLKAVSLSRKGEKSDSNEDASLVLSSIGVFAVADGVGGNPQGGKASREVVDTLYEELRASEITLQSIDRAIEKANSAVYAKSLDKAIGKGMASTLVLAWKIESKLFCYSIGDSRIYRFRGGVLDQLTKDHIKAVQRGNGTKNLVTRAIGLGTKVLPDISEWDWVEEDMLLLSSDGISDQLPNDLIKRIMGNRTLSMSDKAIALVEESERRGGRDDKTVILVFS